MGGSGFEFVRERARERTSSAPLAPLQKAHTLLPGRVCECAHARLAANGSLRVPRAAAPPPPRPPRRLRAVCCRLVASQCNITNARRRRFLLEDSENAAAWRSPARRGCHSCPSGSAAAAAAAVAVAATATATAARQSGWLCSWLHGAEAAFRLRWRSGWCCRLSPAAVSRPDIAHRRTHWRSQLVSRRRRRRCRRTNAEGERERLLFWATSRGGGGQGTRRKRCQCAIQPPLSCAPAGPAVCPLARCPLARLAGRKRVIESDGPPAPARNGSPGGAGFVRLCRDSAGGSLALSPGWSRAWTRMLT